MGTGSVATRLLAGPALAAIMAILLFADTKYSLAVVQRCCSTELHSHHPCPVQTHTHSLFWHSLHALQAQLILLAASSRHALPGEKHRTDSSLHPFTASASSSPLLTSHCVAVLKESKVRSERRECSEWPKEGKHRRSVAALFIVSVATFSVPTATLLSSL